MAVFIWDLHSNGGLISVALGCIVFILIRILLTSANKKKYKLPRGPRPYPLIGNLPTFLKSKELARKLIDLKETYGNAFKLNIGPFLMVFFSDLPTIREGLVKKGEYTKGRANWIYWIRKLFRKQGMYGCMYVFTNPSTRAGCDIRLVFKQSLTGLSSVFSFSKTGFHTNVKEPSLSYCLIIAEWRINGFIRFLRV